MFKVLYADKDTYVTNRVINGTSQVNSNVGQAGSLDLLKLYGYTSTLSGTVPLPNTELSRLLVHFDLDPLRQLVSQGLIDPGNPTFSCRLYLFDVYGGQPTPNNFNVAVFPLSASFDEGLGRDVVYYSDTDACNWLTSSLASGSWAVPGCGLGGSAQAPCDYITASALINGGSSLEARQFFPVGTEDLNIDVTLVISATLAGRLPDVGFRVSFDPSLETDTHSYFVKRFASHTAFNSELQPRLLVRFDDSIQDDTDNLFLDSTSYLFLYNYVRSNLANLTSGSTVVTGHNCLELTLVGNFPAIDYGTVSSSIVLLPGSPFVFSNPSNIAFTGIYTGSLNGSGSVHDLLLVGALTGTVPGYATNVPSGSFTLADGISPALSGVAFFTGSFEGLSGSDTYALTGTFLPAPVDGPFLFRGSYETSSTLGPVSYVLGPFLGSQHFSGINPQVGTYSASILLSSADPNLVPQWQRSGSASFTPVWGSLDGTLAYLTGSTIKAYAPQRGARSLAPRNLVVSVLGVHDSYERSETTTLRINIFDYTQPYLMQAVKLPVELPGVIIRDVHYQVRDTDTDVIAIPFDTTTNSTRLSNDSASMYFKLDASNLASGHAYVIDVLVITDNNQQTYKAASPVFRVVTTVRT